MSGNDPTLDDIETLVTNHPEKFTSPLQTRRSIRNARSQGGIVEEITARSQYDDYLTNGGTPMGDNGELPVKEPLASDQEFASACAQCAAAGGCCIKSITFRCSHGDARMVLPLKDDTRDPVLAVVCDKETNPTIDEVKIDVEHTPNATCCMDGQVPSLTLRSSPPVSGSGTNLTAKLQYDFHGESMTGTDLELFVKVTGKSLWSGVNSLGRDNPFEVCACGGGDQWAAIVRTYPKLSWEAADFAFGLTGIYDSSFNFQSTVEFGGKLEGTYGASKFEIKAGYESDPTQQSKSAVPFLDRAMQRLRPMVANGGATPERSIRSQVKAEHKMLIASANLSLAERPNDHSRVGVDAKITMGFQPLIGLTAKFEVIDMLLTASQAHGAPKPFIDAVKRARDWMARKPDPDDLLYASANAVCDLEFFAKTSLGRNLNATPDTWSRTEDVTLTSVIARDTWDVTGSSVTEVGVKVTVKINVDGRAWIVKATFSASGEASSSLKGTLSGLTEAEKQANPEAKLNVHVEWTGVSIQVQAAIEGSVAGFSAGASGAKKIPIFEAVDLYKSTL